MTFFYFHAFKFDLDEILLAIIMLPSEKQIWLMISGLWKSTQKQTESFSLHDSDE